MNDPLKKSRDYQIGLKSKTQLTLDLQVTTYLKETYFEYTCKDMNRLKVKD